MPEQPDQLDIKDTGNTSPADVAPVVEVPYGNRS
jgi:hypothetical protein